MPAHTRCPKCGVVGFVRFEHVISAGRAVTDYYCGRCQHSWTMNQEDDTRVNQPPKGGGTRSKPPDRSRP